MIDITFLRSEIYIFIAGLKVFHGAFIMVINVHWVFKVNFCERCKSIL